MSSSPCTGKGITTCTKTWSSMPVSSGRAQALQHALSPFVLCLQHVLKAFLDENILVKLPKPHGSGSAAAVRHGEASSSDTATGKAPVASNVVPFERPARRLGFKQPKAKLPTVRELDHDIEQGRATVRGVVGPTCPCRGPALQLIAGTTTGMARVHRALVRALGSPSSLGTPSDYLL